MNEGKVKSDDLKVAHQPLDSVIRDAPALRSVSNPESQPNTRTLQQGALVTFDRRELQTILNVYGRKVAAGEWRDYAIDFTPNRAVFSIFRRTSEVPLFRVEKDPKLAGKQGAYSVVASGGLIMRRGPDLARVVGVLERKNGFSVV